MINEKREPLFGESLQELEIIKKYGGDALSKLTQKYSRPQLRVLEEIARASDMVAELEDELSFWRSGIYTYPWVIVGSLAASAAIGYMFGDSIFWVLSKLTISKKVWGATIAACWLGLIWNLSNTGYLYLACKRLFKKEEVVEGQDKLLEVVAPGNPNDKNSQWLSLSEIQTLLGVEKREEEITETLTKLNFQKAENAGETKFFITKIQFIPCQNE